MPGIDGEHLARHGLRFDQIAERRHDIVGLDAATERIAGMHRFEILLALAARTQHQRWRDAIDPDAARRKRPRGKFGQCRQRIFRQGVAEIVRVRGGKLRVEQVDDQRVPPVVDRAIRSISIAGARTLTAICASNSAALNSPKPSHAKRAALFTSRRTGGNPSADPKIASAQSRVRKIGDHFDRPVRDFVLVMVNVRHDRPAVLRAALRRCARRLACRRQ